MSLKQRLQDDLKRAMIARDANQADVIKGIKSAILYAEVAAGKREEGLSDEDIIKLLQKESKKRTESAELYTKGGSQERADKELAEKLIIKRYLPAQMSEEEVLVIVNDVIATSGLSGMQAMGPVISAVKLKAGANADGSVIAKLVKERLSS